jgi:hypothetical protein
MLQHPSKNGICPVIFLTFLLLVVKCQARNAAANLNTVDAIMCCLVRCEIVFYSHTSKSSHIQGLVIKRTCIPYYCNVAYELERMGIGIKLVLVGYKLQFHDLPFTDVQ